jgi:hypothetical protein
MPAVGTRQECERAPLISTMHARQLPSGHIARLVAQMRNVDAVAQRRLDDRLAAIAAIGLPLS